MPYAGMELIVAVGESCGPHGLMFGLYLLYGISVCNFLDRIRMFLQWMVPYSGLLCIFNLVNFPM